MTGYHYDCIVVGSGHAGSCAAISAVQAGCKRVLMVEKAPEEWVGGNGYFTAGAHRTVHGGLHDLLPFVQNVTAEQVDMEPYTAEDFTADIMRVGANKPSPALVKAVVDGSREAIEWLAESIGITFVFSFNRQAYVVDGKQKFWGGMVLSVEDGGKGLIAAHRRALAKHGVEVWFDSPVTELLTADDGVVGVVAQRDGEYVQIYAPATILAAGGFEANRQMRAEHLGGNWERAKVRGTPYNTGDGFTLVKPLGAKLTGDWGGCHSTCWDAHAPPDSGDRRLTNQYTKSGYPLGVMLNSKGLRFVDEGEDFRNYTYAKFGRAILEQPGGWAFQVWDTKGVKYLREEEYGEGIVRSITADTLEELAARLVDEGLEAPSTFIQTMIQYNNAATQPDAAQRWNPAIKDGVSTQSSPSTRLDLPKSNWALPINEPPYTVVKVGCGITFTFGGLAIDADTAQVLSNGVGEADSKPIPIGGLFCTGEMVGGLFYNNYPGGSGLTAGAVFGRKAGRSAARLLSSGPR
ncbi:FAD/NAD(P)-binding domain superfamily protein [Pleurotus pulmonarius]